MNITVTNFIHLLFQSHISVRCGIFIRGGVSFHNFLLNGEQSIAINGHSAAVDSYILWQALSHEHKKESYMAGSITGLNTPMQLCMGQYTL